MAQILAAAGINNKYSPVGITAYSLHPGIIKSGLQAHDTSMVGAASRVLMKVMPTSTPQDGARTTLFCATSENAPRDAGSMFMQFGKHNSKADKWTKNQEKQMRLLDFAEKQLRGHGFVFDL
jgi:retinol dehydrogenase 12